DPDDVCLAGMLLAYLAHADDMMLASRTWEGLQRRLLLLEKWCHCKFLRANGSKSAAMVFGAIPTNPRRRPTRCFTFGGSDIPWVTEHKFVGFTLTTGTRDIFRKHYEEKASAARKAYWGVIGGCELFVGRGRLPPTVACDMYYALVDCHLTHGCDVVVDVDPLSFAMINDENLKILRAILGVGYNSTWPQLYTELGVYPLWVRRVELALGFLRYVVTLKPSHLVYKAMQESDRLRRKGFSCWMGDLARSIRSFPFPMARLHSLRNITVQMCDALIHELRTGCKRFLTGQVQVRISLHLLHNRLEPSKDALPSFVHLTRRHYLHRISIPDHRRAIIRLLSGRFRFRGVHSPESKVPLERQLCRRCGREKETPVHVFLVC
ncbi:hypothetical protein C8F01DRAFT_959359, partial [Mycena amicta]